MNLRQKFLAFFLGSILFVTGCATTRARHAETPDSAAQIKALQEEVQAKDQQIQDLQSQAEGGQQASSNFSGRGKGDRSILRVPGVSPTELQRALSHAGFDPGPIDGRLGKKTKSAIKAFQRKNHIKADGVVGERTWQLLRS